MADFTPEDYARLDGKTPAKPRERKGRSPWQLFKDSIIEGALNSPLGAEPVARAILKRRGHTDEEINRGERVLRDDLIERRRGEDEDFKDTDTFSPANIGRRATELAGGVLGSIDPTVVLAPGKHLVTQALAQGGINAAVDLVNQGVQLVRGVRDEYNPVETAVAGGGGAILQGAVGLVRGRGRGKPKPNADADGFTPEDYAALNGRTKPGPRGGPAAPGGLPAQGRITSGFGQRRSPKVGASTMHGGIDIAMKNGTPIKASADGVVTKVGRGHAKRGNWVEVDYGNGVTSRYLHLSGFNVKPGDSVGSGKPFARSGATGNVTGPHLHWSVFKNGQAVDPRTVSFGDGARSRISEGEDVTVAAAREDDTQNPALDAYNSALRGAEEAAEDLDAPMARELDETDPVVLDGSGRADRSTVPETQGQMAPIRDPANDMDGPPIAAAIEQDSGIVQAVRNLLADEQGSVPPRKPGSLEERYKAALAKVEETEAAYQAARQNKVVGNKDHIENLERLNDERIAARQEETALWSQRINPPKDELKERRSAKETAEWKKGIQEEARTRRDARRNRVPDARKDGHLPLNIGDRVSTAKGRETGAAPWKITGYYVDAKNHAKRGYLVERGTGDSLERATLYTSAPDGDVKVTDPSGWQVFPAKRSLKEVPAEKVADVDVKIGKDNPGGDWLKRKQARVEASDDDRALFGGATTAWTKEPVHLPVEALKGLRGAADENPVPGTPKYDRLQESVAEKGFTDENAVVIRVTHKGEAFIMEGNNRVAVAAANGVPTVRAEVQWVNGAEAVDGAFSPTGIKALVAKAKQFVKDILSDEEGTFRPYGGGRGGKGGGKGPDGEGPKGPDAPSNRAGNINLDRLTTTKSIDDVLARASDDIELKHQTHEETEELAKVLGFKDADELIKHNPKIEELPAYAVNLRNTLVASGRMVARLGKKIAAGNATEKEFADFTAAWVRHAAIQERASNVAGAGGRLLDSFNIQAKGDKDYNKMLKELPLFGGDPDGIKALADMVTKFADDPAALAKMARDGVKPRAEDYFFSLWYNMVLSGLATHSANIFGTASNLALDLLQRGFSVGLGLPKKLTGNADRTTTAELLARIHGLVAGAKQGLRNMPQAFESGTPADLAARTEHRSRTFTGKAGVLEVPTRTLAAEDEFFRSVAALSDYYGMAARQAAKEGLSRNNGLRKNPDYFARIDELVANPTLKMEASAAEYGKRMRFQDDPSAIGMAVERLRQSQKGDSVIARTLKGFIRLNIPFLRTIDSLFRTAIRNSPLGVIDSVNINDFKAGGARRDMAIARVTTGTAITAALVGMANDGLITGAGPTDYKKRDELMATGWRPYSIKVGDKYVSYQQLQPYATTFTAIGTYVERLGEEGHKDKDLPDHVARIALGVADAALEGVWIEGLARWFKATEDGPAGIGNWLAGIAASSTVPAIVRQTNQAYIDPIERSTVGSGSIKDRVTGRVLAGIPGLSDDLPAKVDTFGRVKEREGSIGPDSASPLKVSTEDKDMVVQELKRLSGKSKGALVNPPNKDGMNDREYEELKQVSGDIFMTELALQMDNPAWDAMSKEEQVKIVKKTVKDARKTAREIMAASGSLDAKMEREMEETLEAEMTAALES